MVKASTSGCAAERDGRLTEVARAVLALEETRNRPAPPGLEAGPEQTGGALRRPWAGQANLSTAKIEYDWGCRRAEWARPNDQTLTRREAGEK